MHTPIAFLLAVILCAFINAARADGKVVHVYNWSDI
jgi:spermidine/putrescine-binding protein